MRADLRTIGALMRRGLNEILRVPGAALPGVLAPTIFMLGLAAVFGKAASLPRLRRRRASSPSSCRSGCCRARASPAPRPASTSPATSSAAGSTGCCSRPTPRPVLLAGVVASARLRALLPATLPADRRVRRSASHWPGVARARRSRAVLVMGLAAAIACYATLVALRFRTQQAAPLMQMGSFIAVLFTTAYAPRELLSGWLGAIADVNPVTHVLEGVRQGFVGDVTWAETWPALVSDRRPRARVRRARRARHAPPGPVAQTLARGPGARRRARATPAPAARRIWTSRAWRARARRRPRSAATTSARASATGSCTPSRARCTWR